MKARARSSRSPRIVFALWTAAVALLRLPAFGCDAACRPLAFAGGGFGAGGVSKTTASTKETKKKKKGGLSIDTPGDAAPALDKWGLPPPTLHDIFPPLPNSTELIPVATYKVYALAEIQEALRGYIPLDLSRHFGDDAVKMGDGVVATGERGVEPMKLRLVHLSPPVLTIDNFLTAQECLDIERCVTDDAAAADAPVQVSSATFSRSSFTQRTSTSWFCHYHSVPVLLAKAKHVLGITLAHMEEPQIVRYLPGQEFSWHYDEIPAAQLPNGGQRLATLLVYLNTVAEGGGTVFRDLVDPATNGALTVQPRRGSALLFFPAAANGTPDDRTLHQGAAVAPPPPDAARVGEEKWIVQAWIHERPYAAAVPPRNRHETALAAVEVASRQLGYIE